MSAPARPPLEEITATILRVGESPWRNGKGATTSLTLGACKYSSAVSFATKFRFELLAGQKVRIRGEPGEFRGKPQIEFFAENIFLLSEASANPDFVPPPPGDEFEGELSGFYVSSRTVAQTIIRFFEAGQKTNGGVWEVVIPAKALDPRDHKPGGWVQSLMGVKPMSPVELGQRLRIKGFVEDVTWSNGVVKKRLYASSVAIVPYEGKHSVKIDGLDSAVCRRLCDLFGDDFARIIAAEPDILIAKTRYSPTKQAHVVKACKEEARAAADTPKGQRHALDALTWADVPKSKARRLLSDPRITVRGLSDNPYLPLFFGLLTFLTGDRFAQKFAPEAAAVMRPRAIVIAALRALADNPGDTIASREDIQERARLDFGLTPEETSSAIDDLEAKQVVTSIAWSEDEIAAAASASVGFKVYVGPEYRARAFQRAMTEARERPRLLGLTALVEAERRIEVYALRRLASPLSAKALRFIEDVIANAGKLLGRPGFRLDAEQADAVRKIFSNRLSIVTGPPGSGKTTIIALAAIVARKLYPVPVNPEDDEDGEEPTKHRHSIYGVALAGRAASMLRDAATGRLPDGTLLNFEASTLHRALGMAIDDDDMAAPRSRKRLETGVLVVDEMSMVNVLLLGHLLDNVDAEHTVLLGDVDQLPPIGPGAPFRDLIARELAPVTRLAHNYRTGLEGIRDLSAASKEGDTGPLDFYQGGVSYQAVAYGLRGNAAGMLWRKLVKSRVSPQEIAIVYPKNVGAEGVSSLNRSVRMTLGLEGAPQVGDIILVTQNCYEASTPVEGVTVEIFNGERCEIIRREPDFFDARFPGSRVRAERIVRFLSDGLNPPEGTAYGYAMTVHKCQGSQFQHVILVTAKPDRFVWWAHLYTAVTRTRKRLTIIGDESDLADWAAREPKARQTLLGRK